MKVLVIGNGGREHAITWKLAQSPLVSKLYCCPGNGGTATIAENIPTDPNNLEAIAAFAVEHQIDLTVVGPDAYLALGTVDLFQEKGLKVYGPTQAAAKLEWSKVFAKEFMRKYQIPTAEYQSFVDAEAAKDYISKVGTPIVIKADGLAAGKGVTVAFDEATALQAVDDIMLSRLFGESGASVVIEEYLEGEEASLLAFCDGKTAVPMLPAQDHKRIGNGDTGPNTGGMGNYAPTTVIDATLLERIQKEILNPTMQAMADEGTPFIGTLFLGLMISNSGPKVIEYNARFGDPETQVVLPLLDADLAEIFLDAIDGQLNPASIKWLTGRTAVCVVAASGGYPGSYATGKVISGLDAVEDSIVFHAGTKQNPDGTVVTHGGRVLNVVHLASNIESAIDGAYRDLRRIHFDGIYYRNDIGKRELDRYHKKL
ncbi:MAG TPA: phosphoribosylamine--glycine ligase [Bacillota bacterium]|nr:phosphoribosylamine--glycine ligase [Bacillota bacterium]